MLINNSQYGWTHRGFKIQKKYVVGWPSGAVACAAVLGTLLGITIGALALALFKLLRNKAPSAGHTHVEANPVKLVASTANLNGLYAEVASPGAGEYMNQQERHPSNDSHIYAQLTESRDNRKSC